MCTYWHSEGRSPELLDTLSFPDAQRAFCQSRKSQGFQLSPYILLRQDEAGYAQRAENVRGRITGFERGMIGFRQDIFISFQ
jgi:hypothetical protein